MENVKWKIEGLYKADAQKVYEEIGDAEVTPQEVLEKARDNEKELHKCFEWNDGVAAEKYRLTQARDIIRSLVIVTEKANEQPVRVFSITSEQRVYQPTRQFLVQQDEYQALLKRAISELEAFKRKYHTLSELETVFEQIDCLNI